jgi:hypothetical protein
MPFNHFVESLIILSKIISPKAWSKWHFFPCWIRLKNAIGKCDEVIVLKSIGNIRDFLQNYQPLFFWSTFNFWQSDFQWSDHSPNDHPCVVSLTATNMGKIWSVIDNLNSCYSDRCNSNSCNSNSCNSNSCNSNSFNLNSSYTSWEILSKSIMICLTLVNCL